ncbi:MAG TPA: type II methionyl aminopeptidase [Candidatus Aenigmarchaeota archaeon]|nr:MAG: type II methionyl aminopeptidase [Candidatus Aenigmarchaeota archaeon]HDD46020.1 type II methionyl aminopeptidase [Candidatus Aenigmarchaeota archaeon]
MEETIMESYLKAGKVIKKIREELDSILKPGLLILDIAEFIESRIKELGCMPAFPVNISINDIVAHYTPTYNDKTKIRDGDLVKIDIGAHKNGYIADYAFTYCTKRNELVETANNALNAGISMLRPGIRVCDISKAIFEYVRSKKKGVVVNLTGHGLKRYDIHAEPSVPNIENSSSYVIKEGDVIALEPFIANTNSYVKDSTPVEIYSYLETKPIRMKEAKSIMDFGKKLAGMPFAKRWLINNGISPLKVELALKQLEAIGAIRRYPTLRESERRSVAQAEHTIIVRKKPIIITA